MMVKRQIFVCKRKAETERRFISLLNRWKVYVLSFEGQVETIVELTIDEVFMDGVISAEVAARLFKAAAAVGAGNVGNSIDPRSDKAVMLVRSFAA